MLSFSFIASFFHSIPQCVTTEKIQDNRKPRNYLYTEFYVYMVLESREERKASVYFFRNSDVGKPPELLERDIEETPEHKVQHTPLT